MERLLAERLEARAREVLARARAVTGDVGDGVFRRASTEPFEPAVIAARVAERVVELVHALIEKNRRSAVLERELLAARWPWADAMGPDAQESDVAAVTLLDTLDLERPRWPPEVAPIELCQALERTGDGDGAAVAQLVLQGDLPTTGDLPTILKGVGERLRQAAALADGSPPDATVGVALEAATRRWPILGCAVILAAEHAVRADARRGSVALSATRNARAAAAVVSQGRGGPWADDMGLDYQRHKVILRWHGVPRSSRLDLAADGIVVGGRIDEDLVCAILDELHADGLRDWIVLHRMAAQQGRTGKFIWSWRAHRAQTAYARRIASKNKTDDEARAEVVRRLWKLKNAELWERLGEKRGKEIWKRVGPHGLIDIPMVGMKAGDFPELAGLLINPEIYAGAAKGANQYFALLPNEVLDLDGARLRLGTLLAFEMRYARDTEGVVVREAKTLWEYGNVRGGIPEPKEWPRAAVALHHDLDELQRVAVLGAWSQLDRGEVTLATRFELRPAPWWRDQVVLGVHPELGPSRAQLPRTGAELKDWREKRGWSQAEAASRLGVGRATLQRAETSAQTGKPLKPALTKALARFSPDTPSGSSPHGITEPASKR